jgi:hypothetical protein
VAQRPLEKEQVYLDGGRRTTQLMRESLGRRPVQFLRSLRDRIRDGEITSTVRLWQRPHVRVGGRYSLPPGEIEVTKLFEVSLAEITPDLARRTGFAGVVDLLKVAKHGPGRRVFIIEFRYLRPRPRRGSAA